MIGEDDPDQNGTFATPQTLGAFEFDQGGYLTSFRLRVREMNEGPASVAGSWKFYVESEQTSTMSFGHSVPVHPDDRFL